MHHALERAGSFVQDSANAGHAVLPPLYSIKQCCHFVILIGVFNSTYYMYLNVEYGHV
jgi:hypothetical protein